MDEMKAPRYWFKSERMRETVNQCMELIQKNGLTYDQADLLPDDRPIHQMSIYPVAQFWPSDPRVEREILQNKQILF